MRPGRLAKGGILRALGIAAKCAVRNIPCFALNPPLILPITDQMDLRLPPRLNKELFNQLVMRLG